MGIYKNLGSSFESIISRQIAKYKTVPRYFKIVSPECEDRFADIISEGKINRDYAILLKKSGKLYMDGMIFQLEGEY